MSVASSAFVPVVTIDDPAPVLAPAPTSRPVPKPGAVTNLATISTVGAMSTQVPNGAKLGLEFSGRNAPLVRFVGARYSPVFALQDASHAIPADQVSRCANDYFEHVRAPYEVT